MLLDNYATSLSILFFPFLLIYLQLMYESIISNTFSHFKELQFQEQQEELKRELQIQRSTQQLLEHSYDNNYNSKSSIDYYRRNYEKPQLITNLNNLNYQNNYNTIQSSAKDILYELKQYEHFADSNQINFNNYVADRRNSSSNSYNAGSNFSQNIINYNNSYYKINNFNVKNKSSPSSQIESANFYRRPNVDKMDKHNVIVECSQLVDKNRETEGKNITIHNFSTSNNVISHANGTNGHYDEDEEQLNANKTNNPLHSHHFTQVK